MEFIKQGDEVLYVWHGQQVADLEQQVNEMKKVATVRVENAEVGLPQGKSSPFRISKVLRTSFVLFTFLFIRSKSRYSCSQQVVVQRDTRQCCIE